MGSGAFEISIAETLLRLSSLEPHQVIHTVGEAAKLAPSATPPKLPYQSCQLMAPTRESIWELPANTTSQVKATKTPPNKAPGSK